MPNYLDIYVNKQIHFIKSEELGFSLYTFTPVPLNNIKLRIENELLQLLIDAHRKLGEVKGMLNCIEDKDFIVNLFRINEAISSCRIDYIDIDYLDLFLTNKKTVFSDIEKVNKYYKAMRFIKLKSITPKSLCNLHSTVMADDETEYWKSQQQDFLGNLRKIQIHLALEKGYNVVNVLKYNPTPQEHVQSLFDEMLEYYNKRSTYDTLIKLALLHYQFESLHPFLGGNGRIGRLLVHKALINSELVNHAILPFSEYLAQDKAAYFDKLWSAQYFEKLAPWVKYMELQPCETNLNYGNK